MKPNEADKIIVKYDYPKLRIIKETEYALFLENDDGSVEIKQLRYSRSLDALVPVWEKMKIHSMDLELKDSYAELWTGGIIDSYKTTGKTLQEAAAIATAKCIKELNNE